MIFKYRARSSDGQMVESTIDAADQASALNALKGMGMIVVNLASTGQKGNVAASKTDKKSKDAKTTKAKSKSGPKQSIWEVDLAALVGLGGRIPLKNLMVFFRQLATMEGAGLSLTNSLDVIAGGEKNRALRDALLDIKARLDRGIPLSVAMSHHKSFNSLLIALIQAGEEGGLLGSALDQGATLLEKQEALRRKIRSAMFYPAFIMIFAVAILIFFFIFLVPKFEETFSALNIDLPMVTLVMFDIGHWFTENWFIVALIIIGTIGLWVFLSHAKGTKKYMDRFKLKIPILKDLILKSAMARSSRTLSALTSAGVPILRSLEMAEGTANNVPVQEGYQTLRKAVTRGVSLGDASRQAGIFPILISQMMRIGEETGHLDTMLERVATWYDQELDEQVKATVSLMEPVLIVFVGGIIAIIAVSIFAPITSAIVQLS